MPVEPPAELRTLGLPELPGARIARIAEHLGVDGAWELVSTGNDAKAEALAHVLDCERIGADVEVGETLVRFVPGGPQGRPQLHAELFL